MADTAMAVMEPEAGSIDPMSGESEWGKMTPEEREVDVTQAVAAVQERRGITPDAPLVEEKPPAKEPERINAEIPAAGDETPADDDAVLPKAKGKDEGDDVDADKADWLDDDTRDFATMMGMDEDFLNAMPSREVLDRVLEAIDKKAFEAGKQLQTGQQPPISPIEKPVVQQPVQQGAQQQQTDDPFAELASFRLDEELGVDDAPKITKAFVAATTALKNLQDRVAQFEQRDQQRAVDDIRRRAVDSLHSLGNTELFGKSGEKATKEQAENIEKVLDAHFIHARGLFAAGRQAAPTPAFLKAAVHLVFGDRISKQQQKRLIEKLHKQSARRTGGSAFKPLPLPIPENETHVEKVRRIASEADKDWKARRAELNG